MNKLILLAFLLISSLFSQEDESKLEKNLKDKPEANKLYLTPVPVIGVNPAFGFIYGVGASASYYFGNPDSTRVSNMLAGVAKTTQGQTIVTLKSTAYMKDDSWIVIGDWRYLNTSQPTYGLGTGPQSSKLVVSGQAPTFDDGSSFDEGQQLEYKYVRLYETALVQLKKNFYFGLGYHLDKYTDIKDNLLVTGSVNPADDVITSHYAYSINNGFDPSKSTLSGASLNLMFDSRDNAINSYEGRYAFASYRYNSEIIGSDQDSSTLTLDYRDYFNLTPSREYPDVFAIWAYGTFLTSGTVPYLDLPATSYDQYAKSGRGFVQGRFRGEQSLYAEVEYRKHFGEYKVPFTNFMMPIGGVIFANAQSMSAEQDAGVFPSSQDGESIALGKEIEPGGGLGLRFMLQKQTRTNLTLDYAVGSYGSSGLYLRLNETF